jgi:hypothetical protein
MSMNIEDPQAELDEPQTSEAFRSFDFKAVDEMLAHDPVPEWRQAQLLRMRQANTPAMTPTNLAGAT